MNIRSTTAPKPYEDLINIIKSTRNHSDFTVGVKEGRLVEVRKGAAPQKEKQKGLLGNMFALFNREVETSTSGAVQKRLEQIVKQSSNGLDKQSQECLNRILKDVCSTPNLGLKRVKRLYEALETLTEKDLLGGIKAELEPGLTALVIRKRTQYETSDVKQFEQTLSKAMDNCLKACLEAGRNFNAGEIARHMIAIVLQDAEKKILEKIGKDAEDPQKLKLAIEKLTIDDAHGYLKKAMLSKTEAWIAIRNLPNSGNIQYEDMHRFIIDGNMEQYGSYIFENEPFYARDTFRGLVHALTINSDTHNAYDQLELLQETYPYEGGNLEMLAPSKTEHEFRTFGVSYMIKEEDMDFSMITDPVGLEDLRKRSGKDEVLFTFVEDTTTGISKVKLDHVDEEVNIEKANTTLNHMRVLLKNANNGGERLMAYAWAARELEINHHFMDGNGRTSYLFLLGLIAQDKDLPMMLLSDPNILDALGPEGLLNEIIKGMERYAEFSEIDKQTLKLDEIRKQSGVKGKTWDDYHPKAKSSKEEK